MKNSNYDLMWAIAILRDDMQKCWREITSIMGYSMWKCRHLYSQVKKEYKLKQ